MKEIRMIWEPINQVPLEEIKFCVNGLFNGRANVTIMKNGTLLFINKNIDDVQSARLVLTEAKFSTDFRVKPLEGGNFIAAFNAAVAVFVGRQEFADMRQEIVRRIDDLKFPSEELLVPSGWSEDEFLAGVYARGKLQRDIYNFDFYERLGA